MTPFWSTFCVFMGGYVLGCLTAAIAGANEDAKRIAAKAREDADK